MEVERRLGTSTKVSDTVARMGPDVDDAAYCPYFPATMKGVAQSWFNSLAL